MIFRIGIIYLLCISISIQGKEIDEKECGKSKGCYREPNDCNVESNCDAMITWKNNGDSVDFEMSAKTDYVAVGLSNDKKMGEDSILACLKVSGSTPKIEIQYSTGQTKPDLVSNYNGITSITNEEENSRVRCRFSRKKAAFGNQVYDISEGKTYYLLVARGSVSGSTMEYHGTARKVSDKVDLTETSNVGGNNAASGLVKAHASLMTIGWAVLIPIGVFMAAYHKDFIGCKEVKGVKLWFWLHRIFVLSGVLFSSIAFILIFVEVGGYSNLTAAFSKAHPILGIIVMILGLINPIMGMLRPSLESEYRSIFVLCHSLVGYVAYSLAFVGMMSGSRLPAANMPRHMLWVYFGHCMLYVVFSICMSIAKSYSTKYRNKTGQTNNLSMKETGKEIDPNEGDKTVNKDAGNCSELPRWILYVRQTLFICLFTFQIGFIVKELVEICKDS